MNVFVLEDELYHHNRIANILSKLQHQMGLMFSSLNYYDSAESLLASKMLFTEEDIFLLDINILGDERAGLVLASRIRHEFKMATIIFFTAHGAMAKEAFSYRTFALDFIEKSSSEEKIIEQLISCILHAQNTRNEKSADENIRFSNRFTTLNVKKSDILYFETLPGKHRIRLYTKDGAFNFSSTLNNLEKTEPLFIRCHKAYLVNWLNVIYLDKSQRILHLKNNCTCPVSRQQYKKISQMY
ncbi:response regulator transcription factor [Enterococcus sp. BWB1-3]|uniref:LytR/AlgR family response regulator transcription factor n=1 Tax=unclassified Enterococcus TaxID=2608891 RepID=UPI0019232551|nr:MULTISPECIES: LytTR family DNA-binding domain-containing protein [unclassified Enterococcus]MBL1230512.1 response regulator transcription factor [Enterococcus sp. BWB1-3]MCB5954227.1 LytTR family DNA-binding domain-containing protein [Enterococcus sp. CWB-B31]